MRISLLILVLSELFYFSFQNLTLGSPDISEFVKWKVSWYVFYVTLFSILIIPQQTFGSFYLQNSVSKPIDKAVSDFYSNLVSIQAHNANINRTYDQGLNEDSFLSFDEKKIYRMGAKMPKKISKRDASLKQILPKSYQIMLKNTKIPMNGKLRCQLKLINS